MVVSVGFLYAASQEQQKACSDTTAVNYRNFDFLVTGEKKLLRVNHYLQHHNNTRRHDSHNTLTGRWVEENMERYFGQGYEWFAHKLSDDVDRSKW